MKQDSRKTKEATARPRERPMGLPGAASAASGESFQTVQTAANAQVLRGVSFTPGTGTAG